MSDTTEKKKDIPATKPTYELKEIKTPFWNPENPGDMVECTVLGDASYSSDGQQIPCLAVMTIEGERKKINMGAAQLRELYALEQPSKGDFLVLQYTGEDQGIKKKGNAMKLFSYHIEKLPTH